MPWLYLRRQDISSHGIDYVEYVGPGLTWRRISSILVISMWSNDIKCRYMFHVPYKNLARKGLTSRAILSIIVDYSLAVGEWSVALDECEIGGCDIMSPGYPGTYTVI